MSDKKRAAVYVRISTPNQVTDAQEWELREYCEQRGWSLVIYSDHGQSGTQLDRPALNDLMNDVRGRKVDVVVVKALDRLTRSKEQSVAIAEECKSLGVELIALNNFESTLTRLRELPEPEPAPQAKMMIVYRGASMVEGWPEKIKAAQKISSYRVKWASCAQDSVRQRGRGLGCRCEALSRLWGY